MFHRVCYALFVFLSSLEQHHRHFICSFLFHTFLFAVLNLIYPLRPLIEIYAIDSVGLLLALYGSTKKRSWFVVPSVISKMICIGACTGVTILSLGETSIKFNTREARMEFRRQRNYPEPMNIMFEDHPTVCIWIYCILVVAAIDVHVGFRDYYTSMECYQAAGKNVQDDGEKPPPYSVCVTNQSQSVTLPTYNDALRAMEQANVVEMKELNRKTQRDQTTDETR